MGDIQFWLYVIIGIIYLISRLRKKPVTTESDSPAGDTRQRRREVRETVSEGEEKPLTFEDLLREITEGKTQREPERKPQPVSPPAPARPAPPRPMYKNYDEEIEDEEESKEVLEDVNYDYNKKDSLYSQYEEAKRQAFTRPSLEDTMSLSTTDMRYGKFKEFEIETRRDLMKQYLGDLKDPEGLKKAFVLSEILQRKF